MRVMPDPKPSRADTGKDITIAPSSNLTVTMTIESKSRRKTVYRVTQRSDGVVVETPRYQPSTSSSWDKKSTFDANMMRGNVPQRMSKEQMMKERRREEDLRGMGYFTKEERSRAGRGGDSGIVDWGRSGYNSPQEMQMASNEFNKPMQRFLLGSGPWTPYNRRTSTIVTQESI